MRTTLGENATGVKWLVRATGQPRLAYGPRRVHSRPVDDFGTRLRQAREAYGDTQLDLANAIGIDPSQVSRWERGVQEPRATQVFAIVQRYRQQERLLVHGEAGAPTDPPEAFAEFERSDIGELAARAGLLETLRSVRLSVPTASAYRAIALALLSNLGK